MDLSSFNVAVIGTGYVGLTSGAALAYLGCEVACIDIDEEKIEMLKKGKSPIHEPGVEAMLENRRLTFTTDLALVAAADVVLICVGTPPLDNGQADLSYVEAVAKSIGKVLQPDRKYVVVVKSTVPVGTAHRVDFLLKQILKERGIDAEIHVASNPEFLREGEALFDTFYPDRIVAGANSDTASGALWHLYRPILEQSFEPPAGLPRPSAMTLPAFVVVDTTSSELIKYAANAFLATKISFINEIAGLCERVGADVREVARGIGLDQRIGPGFLRAGIGWGGSCFGKDTLSLIRTGEEYNYAMPLLEASRAVNYAQRLWVISKLQEALKTLRGRTVGVLGLAFKSNTDDVRDAPSLDVVQHLVERGTHVQAYDPQALDNARRALGDLPVRYCDSADAVFGGAHAVVLLTEWKAFHSLPFETLIHEMETPLVIDGRNFLDADALCGQGYRVIGVGHPCGSL